jgi:hypothetical protein
MESTAKLLWVLVEGSLHHVNEYKGIKPQDRPFVVCPVCNRQVIMRLGEIRTFHAAHRPEDFCSVTGSETAKHLNAKLHIYHQLLGNSSLIIKNRCSGDNSLNQCLWDAEKRAEFIRDWDEVQVEYKIDQYKPDVVLLKEGKVIGAIEVYVSHSIEPEKENYLLTLSIPWIEVDADEIVDGDEKENWQIKSPIPYLKFGNTRLKIWTCSRCAESIEKQRLANEKIDFEIEFPVTAFRIIDFYFPKNEVIRNTYYARKHVVNGNTVLIGIWQNDKVVCSIPNPIFPEAMQNLSRIFKKELKSWSENCEEVDSSMKWQKSFTGRALREKPLIPHKYLWDVNQGWQRNPKVFNVSANEYFINKRRYRLLLSSGGANEPPDSKKISSLEQRSKSEPITESIPECEHDVAYKCMYCHKVTRNWWWVEYKTNLCKCRDCLDRGVN